MIWFGKTNFSIFPFVRRKSMGKRKTECTEWMHHIIFKYWQKCKRWHMVEMFVYILCSSCFYSATIVRRIIQQWNFNQEPCVTFCFFFLVFLICSSRALPLPLFLSAMCPPRGAGEVDCFCMHGCERKIRHPSLLLRHTWMTRCGSCLCEKHSRNGTSLSQTPS